jgi:hypothetical protein
MHLRSGQKLPIEKGSIIVNCTDQLINPPKERLLSAGGHVLSPQLALFFPSATTYLLSTVFFRGKLQQVADKLYLINYSQVPKNLTSIHSSLVVLANLCLLLPHIPLPVLLNDKSNMNTWYPFHRQGLAFARLLLRRQKILRKAEELKLEKYGG